MKKFLLSKRQTISVALSGLASILLVSGIVYSATTINSNVNTGGTLTVSGASALTGDVTVTGSVFASSSLAVTGTATFNGTASTTNLVVGSGNTLSGVIFGTCQIANRTITASTTVGVQCTSATGVTTGTTIFVQATSSLGSNFIIVSASSTAASTIGLYIFNVGYPAGSANTTGVNAINFFGVR